MSTVNEEHQTRELEVRIKKLKAEEFQLKEVLKELRANAKECSNQYKYAEGLCIDQKMALKKELETLVSVADTYKGLLASTVNDGAGADEILHTMQAKRGSVRGNKLAAKIMVCEYINSIKCHEPVCTSSGNEIEENIKRMQEERQRVILETHKLISSGIYC